MSAARDYALLEGEQAAAGIRRIADGRAADAIERLQGARGEEIAVAVHEARKSLKKLRSLLRLVRTGLGDDLYRLENNRFGDAGRLLSDLRDSGAMLETIAALRERYAAELDPLSLQPLMRALGGEPAGGASSAARPREVDRAIALIEAGRAGIGRWPLERDDFKLVRDGLRRAYERGRLDRKAVAGSPTAEAVHEWRKRVKDLWYMSAVIGRVWPQPLAAIADEAHALSSLLGDHHDLAVLGNRVAGDPGLLGGGLPQPTLSDLIERRQDELLRQALPLGRRLYAEKPKRFVARVGAYWKAG